MNRNMGGLLKPEGLLLITSCNWTEEELRLMNMMMMMMMNMMMMMMTMLVMITMIMMLPAESDYPIPNRLVSLHCPN